MMTLALGVHNRLEQESRRVVLINATFLKCLYHICQESVVRLRNIAIAVDPNMIKFR